MSDTKVSALADISAPALADYTYAVLASGPTSKQMTLDRLGGLFDPLYTTGRLTVASGNANPAPGSIGTTFGTLYYTALTNDGTITGNHFQACIYDGTRLRLYDSAQISLALTLTNGKIYDVFLYDNSGTVTMELSAAWTNATTRADALASQSGQVVKSGTTTRRWIGTIQAAGTNLTEDSLGNAYVWNAYNQIPRKLFITQSASHSYNGGYQQWNATAGVVEQINWVSGRADLPIVFAVQGDVGTGSGIFAVLATGLDTTTSPDSTVAGDASLYVTITVVTISYTFNLASAGVYAPQLGSHYIAVIEGTVSTGAVTYSAYSLKATIWR